MFTCNKEFSREFTVTIKNYCKEDYCCKKIIKCETCNKIFSSYHGSLDVFHIIWGKNDKLTILE